jgi:hypothetical protein
VHRRARRRRGAPADAAPDASDSASRSRTGAAPRAVGLQLYTVRELYGA